MRKSVNKLNKEYKISFYPYSGPAYCETREEFLEILKAFIYEEVIL